MLANVKDDKGMEDWRKLWPIQNKTDLLVKRYIKKWWWEGKKEKSVGKKYVLNKKLNDAK